MAAMSVIGTLLNRPELAPLTQNTGATSKSDPGAGVGAPIDPTQHYKKITTADKAGAAILTVLVCGIAIGGAVWLML